MPIDILHKSIGEPMLGGTCMEGSVNVDWRDNLIGVRTDNGPYGVRDIVVICTLTPGQTSLHRTVLKISLVFMRWNEDVQCHQRVRDILVSMRYAISALCLAVREMSLVFLCWRGHAGRSRPHYERNIISFHALIWGHATASSCEMLLANAWWQLIPMRGLRLWLTLRGRLSILK